MVCLEIYVSVHIALIFAQFTVIKVKQIPQTGLLLHYTIILKPGDKSIFLYGFLKFIKWVANSIEGSLGCKLHGIKSAVRQLG